MLEISYLQAVVCISILWLLVRLIMFMRTKHMDWIREAKLLLVYICLIVIARIVFFPWHLVNGQIGKLNFDIHRIIPCKTNLIPIIKLNSVYDGWELNIFGNVLMFIPVGVVWPLCFPRLNTVAKTVLAGFGLTVFIELMQLLFWERCSDVDDVLLNTLGVLIGAILYFRVFSHKKE